MTMNFSNFFSKKNKNSKISDFQDLDHLDGVAISVVNAKLYNPPRDDLVLFYFRNGANYASVYTQSTIISENIKWNKQITSKKIKAILINTRNANAFTGKDGFQGLKDIAEELSIQLTNKKKSDDEEGVADNTEFKLTLKHLLDKHVVKGGLKKVKNGSKK